ncbi:DNA polymerase III subunit gamma/tau [Moraxella osloensis]|uniref:DNA polymerase III subunit gamma/tau n=1 Tax=Faucicola osloensis TaxID=34062 RepID=A0AAD0ACN1_FAUOS|nr:DNA polymerase III subunit gamma/tau [Moraxella osloensis]ATQ82814.1 DNA polymerase III subunit gamma/tau [Moraxella osloensis]ATW85315.1 DNA polymerase III subunit gamma/tau [Moraxella osloensis]
MYQVLARKYRPKNFHELLGQEHVSKALINAIHNQRLHHAYLFTGTRGVGKTTIARILAKCLNCETGVTSEPCGVCGVCQSIDSGRFIDLIEIDAASRTKVEDTRELLDNVPYAPTQGRYKVYLIDEVHMLSTHSFNALLKTLEEPPAHVKFLLATTDPQKLPITIISRCLQFVLKPLPQVALAEYLGTILNKEQISYEPDALWQLSSSAKGSVRDALSLTDQAIAFGNGNVTDEVIRQMLGLIDQADVIAILANIYQQNTQQLTQAIQLLREQVVDAKAVFDRLAETLHQLAILQALPNFDLQINRQQSEQLQQLAQQLPAELLQLYYDIVVKSRENLALANTPMQALEMCLLRLMAFKPLHRNQIPLRPPIASNPDSQSPDFQIVDTTPSEAIQGAKSSVLAEVSVQVTSEQSDNNLSDDNLLKSAPNVASVDNLQQIIEQGIEQQTFDDTHLISNDTTAASTTAGQTPTRLDDANRLSDLQSSDSDHEITAPDIVAESGNTPSIVTEDSALIKNNAPAPVAVAPNVNVNVDTPEYTRGAEGNDIADISPLALLKPTDVPLEGEWTPAKWDYWVFNAREQGWLDEDELVLAKRGVMTGEIHGVSQFATEQNFLTHTATFDNFCQKLQQRFEGIDIRLAESASNFQALEELKPEALQEAREKLALQQATHQLEQQAVTQALLQQHASISSVKLIQ